MNSAPLSQSAGADAEAAVAPAPEGGCPMVQLLETLAGKWTFRVLYRLIVEDQPQRFGELHRSIERITQKELTKYLRDFEALGLVRRTVYAEVPPRVEYCITPYGRTLRAPLDALVQWSREHGEPLFAARRRLKATAVPHADS
ncbi:MAG TPA: helix-turn-helix domain-containing protein [Burkholderiaceae bacterium]|nr:helix-turn-helix domain-containing protein [Burkholderiaceae bacterium]